MKTILSFLFFISTTLGFSQSLLNDDGVISITQNAVLSVSENFTNNGRLVNDGRLVVGQNWLNNGDYDAGSTGLIVLNGEEAQSINHNAQTFQNVEISGGDKIFQADLTVNESIIFTDGKLFSENGAKLIIGPDASISGGSETSYVVGSLYLSSGAERFYPVGTPDYYLPFTMSQVTDTDAIIGVTAIDGVASSIYDNTIVQISTDYYWETDLLDGETAEAIVEVEFRDQDYLDNIENAALAATSDLTEQFEDLPVGARTGDTSLGTVSALTAIDARYFVVARIFGINDRPPVNVLNLVTPNGDGINDYLEIENIQAYPNNLVTIFNRHGKKLYEISGYDNGEVRFEGESNLNSDFDLPEGTYYYVITEDGEELSSGFFELLR